MTGPPGRGRRRRIRPSVRDLLAEAVAGITTRPGRALLTSLGTLLGVGSFVATLGLTTTAAAQISGRFDALKATEVVVQDSRPEQPDRPFPADVETRLGRLNGVRAAGVLWVTGAGELGVRRTAVHDPSEVVPTLSVVAASPGALRAARAVVGQGRLYDRFHTSRAEPVALLGAAAARRLGVDDLSRRPAVFIGDQALTVIGIVDDVDRRVELLLSVIVPDTTAARLWGVAGAQPEVLIHTKLGAARLIGGQAPLALRPHDPDRLVSLVPADPGQLRRGVETDVDTLFLLLAGLTLLIGAVGIANTTLVSVLERVGEIGVRRALGARRRHIAVQFLAESGALGTLGGLLGTCLGVVLVVGVAAAREWTAVLEPATVLPTPLVGTLTGLLAGLYPAVKAATVQPATALRR